MAAAMDAEMAGRRGNAKLSEEDVRHFGVDMLAGMDHRLGQVRSLGNGAADRRRLNELRPSADDGDETQRHDGARLDPDRSLIGRLVATHPPNRPRVFRPQTPGIYPGIY